MGSNEIDGVLDVTAVSECDCLLSNDGSGGITSRRGFSLEVSPGPVNTKGLVAVLARCATVVSTFGASGLETSGFFESDLGKSDFSKSDLGKSDFEDSDLAAIEPFELFFCVFLITIKQTAKINSPTTMLYERLLFDAGAGFAEAIGDVDADATCGVGIVATIASELVVVFDLDVPATILGWTFRKENRTGTDPPIFPCGFLACLTDSDIGHSFETK